MKKVKVAIIGYGLSGRIFHNSIINSLEEFEVCKIVTKDDAKKKLALEETPKVLLVENVDDIFNDESIDLVVISTPNTTHTFLAEQAMKAGKHVVIEKPFTVTSKEALKLIQVSNDTGKVLSVYQNRRFDGDFKTVKRVIDSRALGRLVEFESHFDRFRNTFKDKDWREEALPGSGKLYDLGAHLIDQALDLFGLPNEVYGDLRSQRKGKVDDNFELILYYTDLKVTLKSSSLVKEELPRFILQGTEGAYVKFGLDVQEEDLRSGKRPNTKAWGQESDSMRGVLNTISERKKIPTEPGDYRDYYRNIYASIVKGEALTITGQDGLNVIKIIEAAILSNDEKRRVVID